jgi:hypothetical protein
VRARLVAGGGEVLPFGVLTFVVGTLLVARGGGRRQARRLVRCEGVACLRRGRRRVPADAAARAAVDALPAPAAPSEVRLRIEVPGPPLSPRVVVTYPSPSIF